MKEYLNKTLRELKIRNYSPKTIQAYSVCLRLYLKYKKNNLNQLDEENVKDFLLSIQEKGKSPQTINLAFKV